MCKTVRLTYHAEDLRRKHGVAVDSGAYAAWRQEHHLEPVTRMARPLSPGGAIEEEEEGGGRGAIEEKGSPIEEDVRSENTPNGSELAVSSVVETGPSRPDAGVPRTGDADGSYPRSFAHIVNLIKSGEPIPGVKEIPDTVLEGQESNSTIPPRRKPWEKDQDEVIEQEGSNISTGP
ncbi:MAG: hypothetical protein M1823_004611 [Watsoniomyces obsoletus]|nr:MAG: hypothetical protein M1823_004611 [Watsoniomyces obsoletus]